MKQNKMKKGMTMLIVILLLVLVAVVSFWAIQKYGIPKIQKTAVPTPTPVTKLDNVNQVSNSDDVNTLDDELTKTKFDDLDSEVLGVKTAADSLSN